MTSTSKRTKPRRGFVAVALLLGLMVIAAMIGVLMRSALMQKAALARAERALQAEALAESGVERAAAKLKASSDYAGEDWEPSAAELGRRDDALVAIRVEKVEGRPNARRIVVRADYPRRVESRSRVARSVVVEWKASK